jgi:hypothetical protein
MGLISEGSNVKIDAATKKVELATKFTVGDYIEALSAQNREMIANGIHRRFKERYLDPIYERRRRHGFTLMGVACLMIEAIESFRCGWPDTRGRGEHAFCSFFAAHLEFAPFQAHAREFYEGVRCGILHQAETTLGWRIRRDGDLLNVNGPIRTVNATKFVKALALTLESYHDQLKTAEWNDELWLRLRIKMERVCANCASKSMQMA